MQIGIKYGGSGNIKTSVLENAQEQIVRARTLGVKSCIDSNLVMCLVTELLEWRNRYPPCPVSEFTLSDSLMLPPDSYVEPELDLEALRDAEDIEDEDLEDDDDDDDDDDEIEVRNPVVPKKRRVADRSSDYWLETTSSRVKVATALTVLIAFVVAILMSTI